MSDIPSVEVFKNITPANAGSGDAAFVYEDLSGAVADYRHSFVDRSAEVWETPTDSLEELRAARQLSMEYLLRTALQATEAPTGPSSDLWADRFTAASIELYGEPDKTEVIGLMRGELQELWSLADDDAINHGQLGFLIGTYSKILDNSGVELETTAEVAYKTEREQLAMRAYGEAIREKYQPLFDLVDDESEAELGPDSLRALFEKSLKWLVEHDDKGWFIFEAVIKNNATSVSTSTSEIEIRVGDKRAPANHSTCRRLIAHELLVHAMRGKNAWGGSDMLLVQGYPGFLDAEEGLAVFTEDAIEGAKGNKGQDRYVDTALALGTVDGRQRSRREVFEISKARKLINAQRQGTFSEDDLPKLERQARVHVDRIFRGGKGDDLNQRQAIYTKDLAYYNGHKKMVEYITEQIESGTEPQDIFAFLSSGCFDPTNPRHIERLKAQTSVKM